ncbi:MAG: hypothetical protein NTV23_03855 [Propionibacteriales bacterium]|nr:hypothetical protein [Propionibacteriales bacterium]
MYRDFFRAFTDLFSARRSRGEIAALLLVMALLPVSELVVTHMFSRLILAGAKQYDEDPRGVLVSGAIFFAAFALSRALHHVVRLNRVRVFRRGFERSGEERPASPASTEAWSWAAAFELSTALVSLIQIVAFCSLFTYLDPAFGLANLLIAAGVLWLVAAIYHRQLSHQVAYLAEGNKPGSTKVGDRVGKRIRDAELGAIVASLAMAVSLGLVLVRAIQGGLSGPDAIVLFIGLRMLYSQVGNLSASAMRFARVKARLAAGSKNVDVIDPDDEFADPDTEIEDAGDLQPARPTAHRTQLVSQMMVAGQRGDLELVGRYAGRLSSGVIPTEAEVNARTAAEAFAQLAAPTTDEDVLPLSLLWWARPFPGAVGNWVSPLLLRRITDRPVLFQTPNAAAVTPHLLMVGSVIASAHEQSIVVGTGALNAGVKVDPAAHVVSVRGPLTAAALRAAGGPSVESFGDPTLLAGRHLPVQLGGTNGRLAFVRHVSHGDVPVSTGSQLEEISPLASQPEQIEALVRRLGSFDGVVTSDAGTMVLCHAYGIPCAAVTFDGTEDLDFVYRDYALGAGLGEDVLPQPAAPDLRKVDWHSRLHAPRIEPGVLDEIQAAVDRAVRVYSERVTS